MPVQVQVRRGTAAAWAAANSVLLAGEIGYETNTGLWKVGDGTTAWNVLSYAQRGATGDRGIPGLDGDDTDTTWEPLGINTLLPQREFLIKPVTLTADTGNQASTTEAIISPQLTVPAGLSLVGTTFEVEFAFSAAQAATAQTTPGILFRLRWGGLTGTIIATAGVITPATVLAASPGFCRAAMTIRTLGASGTAKGYVIVEDPRGDRATLTTLSANVLTGKSGGAVTINTTTSNIVCVTCQTTVADATAITFGESGFAQMVAY